MKQIKAIVISVILAICLSLAVGNLASAASYTQEGYVVNYVKLRTAPSTSSSVIYTLKKGDVVAILERTNKYWMKVQTQRTGDIGYMSTSASYVTIKDIAPAEPVTPVEPVAPVEPVQPVIPTKADKIIVDAESFIGKVDYHYGVRDYNKLWLDCSSFTEMIFEKYNGISLPWGSVAQSKLGTLVSRSNLQKGDLVFFDTNRDGKINHVGIYIEDEKFIHNNPSGGVHITALSGSWSNYYVTARRVIQ